MSDIERAAFEEWTAKARGALDLSRKLDGTYRVASRNVELMVWQARASRPVVVTDEMVEAGARASWLHHLYPCNDAAWDAFKTEYPDAYAREIRTMRISLSAALNGGTDG